MSTQEEAAGEGAELSAVRAQELVRVNISSMTGHEWSLNITPDETVQSLKEKIWRHCGLLPYHQGLIFAEESLTDRGDQLTLRSLGVRQNSTIRLVVVTRSGPLALHHPHKSSAHVDITTNDSIPAEYWNGERIFDERFLEENRRKLLEMCELQCQMKQNSSIAKPVAEHFERRVISAPEDTSAKESSAGDTECDDEKIMDYSSKQVSQTSEALPLSLSRNSGKRAKQNLTKAEDGCISSKDGVPSARDRLLVMMQARATSSSTDVNTHSEDGSEFSSGMIICDLSNEFRRLRVRRKHHATGTASGALQKARARSKPRAPAVTLTHQHRGSDVTSSDDEYPLLRRAADSSAPCSGLRRPSAIVRAQKVTGGCQSQQRCYACAAKLNNYSIAFQCRCGKTLCARHRPAEMHMCTRLRKLQDVSD